MDHCKYAFVQILSTGAILTTLLFGFWCHSFAFEAKTYELSLGGQTISIDADDLHFSPWYRQKTDVSGVIVSGGGSDATMTVVTVDSCVEWGTDEDSKWKFVKFVTVLTPLVGGIMTLMLCAAPCFGDVISKAWHCMALTYIMFLTMFQALAFLIYRSNACTENPVFRAINAEIEGFAGATGVKVSTISDGALWDTECSWDRGSSFNVVSTLFWCLTGVGMLLLGAPSTTEGERAEKNAELVDDTHEKGENGKQAQPFVEEDPVLEPFSKVNNEKQEEALAEEDQAAEVDNNHQEEDDTRHGENDEKVNIADTSDVEVPEETPNESTKESSS